MLFLGRIVPEKGVHYLIDAFKRLDTGKRLVIAGGASDSAEYYESVRKAAGSDPRIVLAGSRRARSWRNCIPTRTRTCCPAIWRACR